MMSNTFHSQVEIVRNPGQTSIVIPLAWSWLLFGWQETNSLQNIDGEEKYFIPSQEFPHTNPLSNSERDHFVIFNESKESLL